MFHDLFWAIYWIDVLSGLPGLIGLGALLAVMPAFFASFLGHDKGHPVFTWRVPAVYVGIVLVTALSAFIPSKQTMYMMLGVKTTENVVETPLGKKLQQIIDAEVDGYLKKLQPNSKE
jgi:hypothetical protein